jgi:hypothetical protein
LEGIAKSLVNAARQADMQTGLIANSSLKEPAPLHVSSLLRQKHLARIKAVQLVKRKMDSCNRQWAFCKLADLSRFMWLQLDWICSREQGFLKDGGLG